LIRKKFGLLRSISSLFLGRGRPYLTKVFLFNICFFWPEDLWLQAIELIKDDKTFGRFLGKFFFCPMNKGLKNECFESIREKRLRHLLGPYFLGHLYPQNKTSCTLEYPWPSDLQFEASKRSEKSFWSLFGSYTQVNHICSMFFCIRVIMAQKTMAVLCVRRIIWTYFEPLFQGSIFFYFFFYIGFLLAKGFKNRSLEFCQNKNIFVLLESHFWNLHYRT